LIVGFWNLKSTVIYAKTFLHTLAKLNKILFKRKERSTFPNVLHTQNLKTERAAKRNHQKFSD
jgi:hypothetical protein